MSAIKVEKFIDGNLESSFGVPVLAITILVRLLPASAISELVDRGVDILAVLDAHKLGMPYSSSIDVSEGGVRKTVVVSVA